MLRGKLQGEFAARVGIFAIALTALWLRSRSLPVERSSPEWQLALERGVTCVRAVAERASALGMEGGPCSNVAARPLAALLGAWAKLSVGRLGLLELATSARLPWLLSAALAPVLVFALLARAHGKRTAAFAAAWLLTLPGFTAASVAAEPDVQLGASWLFVLAPYAAWCAARRAGERTRALALLMLGSVTALAFVLGAAWALPLMIVHFALEHAASSSRLLRRGRLPLPSAALVCALGCLVACVLFDPSLWHSDPPRTIVALFAGRAGFLPPERVRSVAPWIWLLALAGVLALGWRALGRRFATLELRPRRDTSGSGALLTLGLMLAYALGGSLAALPYLAMAAALGASALATALVRERWRLPLELLLLALAALS